MYKSYNSSVDIFQILLSHVSFSHMCYTIMILFGVFHCKQLPKYNVNHQDLVIKKK